MFEVNNLVLIAEEVLDGTRVYHLIGEVLPGAFGGLEGELQADYWIGVEDSLLRQIIVEGEDVRGTVAVDIHFSDFGTPVAIEAPELGPAVGTTTPTSTPVPPTRTTPASSSPGQEILEATAAAMEEMGSFHFETDMRLGFGLAGFSGVVRFTTAGDFQAPDRVQAIGSVSVFGGLPIESEFIAIGDTEYQRIAGTGRWEISVYPSFSVASPVEFIGVEFSQISDVVLLEQEVLDGTPVIQLMGRALPGFFGDLEGDLQAYLRIGIEDSLLRQIIVEGEDGRGTVAVDIHFSDFGKTVAIEAPAGVAAEPPGPEDFDLAAMLPTLADLSENAFIKDEDLSCVVSCEREFGATGLVMTLGSSNVANINAEVELEDSSIDARINVEFVKGSDPELFSEPASQAFAAGAGFTPDNVVLEALGPIVIGDAAAGFFMRIETAIADFDGYLLFFAQGRVSAQLLVTGPADQIALADIIPLAQLMADRIQENSP